MLELDDKRYAVRPSPNRQYESDVERHNQYLPDIRCSPSRVLTT